MSKTLILLAVATVANTGCCGAIRNLFHRGAPCGTTAVAPAVLGAPVAMGGPTMGPGMPYCPEQCIPCDPCEGGAWTSSGYFGGHEGYSDCNQGVVTSGPVYDGGYLQPSLAPAPESVPAGSGSTYRDPAPLRDN